MATVKCGFCPETIEAPLWPEEKPPGWEITPDGIIICPAHESPGFNVDMTVPTGGGGGR